MVWFNRLSITKKLTLLFVVQSCLVILVVGGCIIVYSATVDRKELVRNGDVLAQVIGGNSQAALAFNLPDDGETLLKGLEKNPSVLFAALLDTDKKLFASYSRNKNQPFHLLTSGERGHTFEKGNLRSWREIRLDGDILGYILMVYDLSDLNKRRQTFLLIVICVILGSILISFLLSRGMQRLISNPVLELSNTMHQVAASGDYSVTIKKAYQDEIGTLVDSFNNLLSQIKERDRALSQNEEQYRSIFNATGDAMFIHDAATGKILATNDRVGPMFGYDESELPELSISQISSGTPPYTQENANQLIQEAVSKGSKVFTWQCSNVDGSLFWVEVSLTHASIAGESRVIAAVRDISERKESEAEMERMRSLMKNIIDSMPSALVGLDPEGTVTQWNAQAEGLTGLKATEIVGQPIHSALDQYGIELEKIKLAISSRQIQKIEKIAAHEKDGTHIRDITIFPLVANSIEGAVIRIDDITNRVRMENMMVQTEKMMSVGGLAAGMAHEINNPLSGILQGSQNILRRVSDELDQNHEVARQCETDLDTIRHYLDERQITKMLHGIRENGIRAAKIVENMLQFSRGGGSGKVDCNIADLIDRAVALAANDYDLKKKFDFRHIAIQRDYDSSATALCVPTEIEQVVLNILKNAAQAMATKQYTAPEGPAIHLSIRQEPDQIVISIRDNGPGVDIETQKRMFEPFFTTKPVGEGTGLGLSVSYFIIVDNHGGRMWIESFSENGTTFYFSLPK